MKTLCLFETFPSVFFHSKPWKPASLAPSSSPAAKSRSRCNSFKIIFPDYVRFRLRLALRCCHATHTFYDGGVFVQTHQCKKAMPNGALICTSLRRSAYERFQAVDPSLGFADHCIEHTKKENHVPKLAHLKSFSEMHDMMLKFMGSSRSLNLASNKFDFRLDIIHDVIREHYLCTSLKDNCASFPEVGVIPKMALLSCIILTFLTSQQAFATPEFTSSLQSPSFFENLGDINTGFASAFLLIFFSELGDKTFFIAALLAARNSGVVVFAGTFGALATMTIVSVVLGRTFHYVDGILPFSLGGTDFPLDDFAAVCLLVYFGVTTLLDAASGDESKIKEEQEEAELAISELRGNGVGITAASSTVISTFLLVFVAEWGDKSFFSTVALAAASSPLGVIGGALAGHAFATSLAVLGGSILGTYFSEKVIAYIGGTLFLVFAGITLVEILS